MAATGRPLQGRQQYDTHRPHPDPLAVHYRVDNSRTHVDRPQIPWPSTTGSTAVRHTSSAPRSPGRPLQGRQQYDTSTAPDPLAVHYRVDSRTTHIDRPQIPWPSITGSTTVGHTSTAPRSPGRPLQGRQQYDTHRPPQIPWPSTTGSTAVRHTNRPRSPGRPLQGRQQYDTHRPPPDPYASLNTEQHLIRRSVNKCDRISVGFICAR